MYNTHSKLKKKQPTNKTKQALSFVVAVKFRISMIIE